MRKNLPVLIGYLILGAGALSASPPDRRRDPPGNARLVEQVTELEDVVRQLTRRLDAAEARAIQAPAPGVSNAILGAPAPGGISEAEQQKLEAEFARELGQATKGAPGLGADPAPPQADAPMPPAAGPAPQWTWALPGGASSLTGSAAPGGGRLKVIDIGMSLLNDMTGSTAQETDLRDLNAGDHDPRHLGFTAPNEELTLGGIVDPYFRGDVDIVWKINDEGETGIELEEAFLTSLALEDGLQLLAGTFYTRFGRLNFQHPHAWDWANQPVIFSRIMSPEALRGPGIRLSKLLETGDFNEISLSAQAPEGDPMQSFNFVVEGEDSELSGRPLITRNVEDIADLVWTGRFAHSHDVSDEKTIAAGVSVSTGPNATSLANRTSIYGVDFYSKWKPLSNDHGFPFFTFQAEVLHRNYQADAVFEEVEVPDEEDLDADGDTEEIIGTELEVLLADESLLDTGFYAQAVYGFKRNWAAGLRVEHAQGKRGEPDEDPFRDRRWRVSPNLTHYFSEFSKLRFQYDWDDAQHLPDEEHTFTMQYEIDFGAHAAHIF